MIIGHFDSFIVNTGNNNCVCPKDSKYCRYTASTGGYQVTGYGVDCKGAIADWNKLASRKHYTLPPAKGGSNGGLSANSVKQAQAKGSSNTPASIFEPIFGTAKTGISASGKAGAGVTAGASISATVSDLQAKTDKVVSDVLPDSIESSIEGAGIPLWMLPLGIVGAGLLLILLVRR
jgi:hypothetical protein